MIDTFSGPLDRHAAELYPRFVAASVSVKGAQQRVQAVLDDIESLSRFSGQVEEHLRRASFARLPSVRGSDGAVISNVHKLTIRPWEGTFLVSADGLQVIGLVFSREPHDYLDLLGDMLVAYHKAHTS